jgi:pilus assembly protein CpaE
MSEALRTIFVGGVDSPVRRLLGDTATTVLVGEFRRVAQAVQEGGARRPDLLVVDLPDDRATGPEGPPAKIIETLTRAFPDAAVFATGLNPSADFVIEIIRAGAVEFLLRPVQPGHLAAALEKVLRLRRAPQPAHRAGRITSVFSSKGGLGVTTVATNVAVCLAERSPRRTLLVDLDTRQSDVATFLNLRSTYSVADALENTDRLDASFLQGLVAQHASGLLVLPAPSRIERGQLAPEHVQVMLEVVRSHYDHVVLDLRHDLDPGTVSALEASDTILFVTGLTVSALRSAAASLAAFRHLGLSTSRLKVVVMREGTGADVTLKHAQDTIGLPIHWRTPSDYHTVVSAINSGEPVVTASPRSKIARSLRDLAGTLHSRPGAAARTAAGRQASLMRLVWTTKGTPGDV